MSIYLSENKDHNWNWIIDTKVVRTELKLDNTELSNEIDQENLRVYFLIETFTLNKIDVWNFKISYTMNYGQIEWTINIYQGK